LLIDFKFVVHCQ